MSDEKTETEALATNRQPQKALTALADLLQRCGHSPKEAQAIAAQTIHQQTVIDPGVTFGHIHAEQLGNLWKQAAKHGKRKLVLEISADALSGDEWDGHINVEVKDAQTWKQYEQRQRAETQSQQPEEKPSASRVMN